MGKKLVYIIYPIPLVRRVPEFGKGTDKDVAVVKQGIRKIFSADELEIKIIVIDRRKKIDRYYFENLQKGDVSIFIGYAIDVAFVSRKNWVLVNHEYSYYIFSREKINEKILSKIDKFLCKTKIGFEVIKNFKDKYHYKFDVEYIGFTSPFFRCLKQKNWNLALHAGYATRQKNSGVVLRCWYKYHDLLDLIFIKDKEKLLEMVKKEEISEEIYQAVIKNEIKNLRYFEPMPENEFEEILCTSGLILAPSRTEGFGHFINEGRMVKSVVIVPDYPPMNELINEDSGILVRISKKYQKTEFDYFVDISEDDLHDSIIHYMELPDSVKEQMAQKSFENYVKGRKEFFERFGNLLEREIK
jgi:hypothetical protein